MSESCGHMQAMLTTMSGLPVVESSTNRKLLGVVSKKDMAKSGNTVKEVGRFHLQSC